MAVHTVVHTICHALSYVPRCVQSKRDFISDEVSKSGEGMTSLSGNNHVGKFFIMPQGSIAVKNNGTCDSRLRTNSASKPVSQPCTSTMIVPSGEYIRYIKILHIIL